MRCESVVDGHGDSDGGSSLYKTCDVSLEWQVTSTVAHHLNTVHPLHTNHKIASAKQMEGQGKAKQTVCRLPLKADGCSKFEL